MTTGLEGWLRSLGVTSVVIVGFYAHMCLSTSAREALIRGFDVAVDPDATGARDLDDPILGRQSADEVRRSALLHLTNMGVTMSPRLQSTEASAPLPAATLQSQDPDFDRSGRLLLSAQAVGDGVAPSLRGCTCETCSS